MNEKLIAHVVKPNFPSFPLVGTYRGKRTDLSNFFSRTLHYFYTPLYNIFLLLLLLLTYLKLATKKFTSSKFITIVKKLRTKLRTLKCQNQK